ncbi:MAG: isoprenylcysteine carboxylmethyltransferase family protein [Bryobacteraceae bacterium]
MPVYAYGILLLGWLGWVMPFLLARRARNEAAVVDRRARWGILLVVIAYSLLWQNRFWERSLPAWRTTLAVFFFVLACVLSWSGARALGRQWRLDAGLNADHELVTSGPYRLVRHPIYTSMLCVLCGTGWLLTPLPMLLAAVIVFTVGTEIRVRIEDRLLGERFGESFRQYQRRVAAYVPFLR